MARADRLPPDLKARFERLLDASEGLIAHKVGKFSQIAVARTGADIFMAFCPLAVPLRNENLSAVMARYDPSDPLLLRGRYMQAMLAAHAFAPDPAHIYLMGAGGGRLALVQRYLLEVPDITGCELDPEVLRLSRNYFGLTPGPGLAIDAAEGGAHLAAQGPARFDHVYIDCFTAQGRVPPHLAATGAISAVRKALRPGGVMAMNLLASDPGAPAILSQVLDTFESVWQWQEAGSLVIFGQIGTNGPRAMPKQARDLGFDLAADVARLTRPAPRIVNNSVALR